MRSYPVRRLALWEQRRIADFLDAQISRGSALQARRSAQLRLLEEREQVMLDEVLIDTSTKVPLRLLARIQTGVTVDASRARSGLVERPYLRVANVKADRLDLDDIKTIMVTPEDAHAAALRAGDVLMTEGGDLDKLGRGTVWRGEIRECIHQNHVFAVRPGSRLSGEYLALLTRTSLARAYFAGTGTRTTNLASTSSSKIGSFRIPLPPLRGQLAMVAKAGRELATCAALRTRLASQDKLLGERQQGLVTAAVTGEIDVTTARGVA